MIFSLC